MAFEIVGKLHKKFDTEQKTPSFSAREFVIYTDKEQYPQYIKFQLTQDRCSLIDAFSEGDIIKVYFDLRGREWQGKYFTNLNAWRIEKDAAVSDTAPPAGVTEGPAVPFPTAADAPQTDSEDPLEDDLPF